MKEFKLSIEKNTEPGMHRFSVVLYQVNIDPRGYEVADFHGKSLKAQLRKAMTWIEENGGLL